MSYIVVWRFEVEPEHIAAFESAYGPEGDWAQLFRRYDGFVSVELLRDRSHSRQYLTIDRWLSLRHYQDMRRSAAAEYARIDVLCADFTSREEEVGEFDVVDARAVDGPLR